MSNRDFENADTILRASVARINEQRAKLFAKHLKNTLTPEDLAKMRKANTLLAKAFAALTEDKKEGKK